MPGSGVLIPVSEPGALVRRDGQKWYDAHVVPGDEGRGGAQQCFCPGGGLFHGGQTVVREDRPEVLGMIRTVAHLVEVEEVK